ncbi:MAG: SDR family oxidoreductase [Bacteroidia bacterium]
MNLSLHNKNALVCGSTQGIGKATALALAELGANVTLLARNEAKLQATLAELSTSQGQTHSYLVADFSQPDSLVAVLAPYQSQEKQIHILVNNTGGPAGGAIASAKIEEFQNTFSQHLICNHLLAQAVLEGMKSAGYGRIINVISTSVKQPLNGLGVSNTIRAAVANWSKTLANEVAKFGITVNNVLPGATETERLQSIIHNKAVKAASDDAKISEGMKAEIPAGRFGKPEEIANAIAFLASPAAAYVCGINLPVDGGRTGCL